MRSRRPAEPWLRQWQLHANGGPHPRLARDRELALAPRDHRRHVLESIAPTGPDRYRRRIKAAPVIGDSECHSCEMPVQTDTDGVRLPVLAGVHHRVHQHQFQHLLNRARHRTARLAGFGNGTGHPLGLKLLAQALHGRMEHARQHPQVVGIAGVERHDQVQQVGSLRLHPRQAQAQGLLLGRNQFLGLRKQ